MTTFADRFGFPVACRVNQRIAKTLFGESGSLTTADKRILSKDVEEVRCLYVMDRDGTQIVPVVEAERDYSCLAVIGVTLRTAAHADRIDELCHRAMPYPLFVVMEDEAGLLRFSMAEKRISHDGREGTVLEHKVSTVWLDAASCEPFIQASQFPDAARRDFRDVYGWYMERLEALNAAHVTGVFKLGSDPVQRRANLASIHELEGRLAALRRQVRRDTPIAELVDLNMKIKSLEREREALAAKL